MHRQHAGGLALRFTGAPVIQTGFLPVPAEYQGRRQGLSKRSDGIKHRRSAQHQLVELVVQLSGAKTPRSGRVSSGVFRVRHEMTLTQLNYDVSSASRGIK